MTNHDINGNATAWLFPGALPLGLALVALVGGTLALARGVARSAAGRPFGSWFGVAPEYRWPVRILAAGTVAWVLLLMVRPVIPADHALSVERFGDSTVVETGYLTVGEPGTYRFQIAGEGGARLIVNERVIIDHHELNPGAPRTGRVELAAGSHRVLLQHTQGGEAQPAFTWGWRPPADDEGYRPVPSWALSQRPVSYPSVLAIRLVDVLLLWLAAICGLVVAWCIYLRAAGREAWGARDVRCRPSPTGLYLLLTVVCIALAIGPPYGLWQYVYWLPGFNFIRVPSRFMVLGVLGVAVLAAIGFDRMTGGLAASTRRLAGIAVAALLLLEVNVVPFTGVPFQLEIPAVDQWLARKGEAFSVVEVPATRSDRYHVRYMLHSMAHWQKTVHGYSGIRPRLHGRLYEHLETFPNDESLRELTSLDVTYVVVHLNSYQPEERRSVERRLQAFDSWLTLQYADAESRVYSIHRPSGLLTFPTPPVATEGRI